MKLIFKDYQDYNLLLKSFVIYQIISITVILCVHSLLYLYLDIPFFIYYNLGFALLNILVFFYIRNLSFSQIQPFINFYLILESLFLLLYAVCLWEKTPIAFFWFFLIPFFSMTIYSQKTIIYWVIYIFVLIVFTVAFSKNIYHLIFIKPIVFPTNGIVLVNTFALISIFFLFALGGYFSRQIHSMNLKNRVISGRDLMADAVDVATEESANKETIINNQTLKLLYDRILIYFEESQPYRNSGFSTIQLANALDTNILYISKAISIYGNTNFSTFVNRYRISLIKKLLNNKELDKHSLLYVYTLAGFKHQSTFNKVFKQIEGVTPSEYVKNMNI